MKTQYVTADELVETLGVSKGKAYQMLFCKLNYAPFCKLFGADFCYVT